MLDMTGSIIRVACSSSTVYDKELAWCSTLASLHIGGQIVTQCCNWCMETLAIVQGMAQYGGNGMAHLGIRKIRFAILSKAIMPNRGSKELYILSIEYTTVNRIQWYSFLYADSVATSPTNGVLKLRRASLPTQPNIPRLSHASLRALQHARLQATHKMPP